MDQYPSREPELLFVGDGRLYGHRVERSGLTILLLVITATTVHNTSNPKQPIELWTRAENIANRIGRTVEFANQKLEQRTDIFKYPTGEEGQIVFYCVPPQAIQPNGLCARSTLTDNSRKQETVIELGPIFFGDQNVMAGTCGGNVVPYTAHGSPDDQFQAQKVQYNMQKQTWLQEWSDYRHSRRVQPPSLGFTWTHQPRDAGKLYKIQACW